jgi:hypothetical protein
MNGDSGAIAGDWPCGLTWQFRASVSADAMCRSESADTEEGPRCFSPLALRLLFSPCHLRTDTCRERFWIIRSFLLRVQLPQY